MSQDELRSTMTGAPLWARAATVAAGPLFNFALSIVIFTAVFMVRGVVSEPLTVGDLRPLPVAQELRVGDEIVAIEGKAPPAFEDGTAYQSFMNALPQDETLDYTVIRDGSETTVSGPYVLPPIATQIAPRSAAGDAGLRQGDVIVRVDGAPIFAFDQLAQRVEGSEGRDPGAGDLARRARSLPIDLAPRRVDEPQPDGTFQTFYRIGIIGGMSFEPATTTPGSFEALGSGVGQVGAIVSARFRALAHGDRGDQHLQPVGSHRHRRDLGRHGEPGHGELHLVHCGPVNGCRPPEPLSRAGPRRRPPGVLRLRGGFGPPAQRQGAQGPDVLGIAVILGLMVFALSNECSVPDTIPGFCAQIRPNSSSSNGRDIETARI